MHKNKSEKVVVIGGKSMSDISDNVESLVDRLRKGDKRAAARLISLAENRSKLARDALKSIYQYTGKAQIIGITGPSGSGKSTLVDKLVSFYRKQAKTVGVVAVDPSSPFSGGAFLGDRIRMSQISTDPGVFIRSMASRGSLGGLAWATRDAVRILDAMGKDVILVETVGIGQAEVDIIQIAHTIVLLSVPGLGDDIQTIKAGLMEIGDVFVVNKADRVGAEITYNDIQSALELGNRDKSWTPPILKTIATSGVGISELVKVIDEHKHHLDVSGELKTRLEQRLHRELKDLINDLLTHRYLEDDEEKEKFERTVKRLVSRTVDPYTAAENFAKKLLRDK